jgi:integrase
MRQSVYKRKDGRYEGYVIYTDPDTGKENKKSFYAKGTHAQREIRRKTAAFMEKIEAGDYSDVNKVTLEGWLNKYFNNYCADCATTTKEAYQNYIKNHINPFIGHMLIREIKPIHIQGFYNHERSIQRVRTHIKDGRQVPILKDGKPIPLMKDGKPVIGYTEKTILHEHRILRRAFQKALNDGLISKNPCDGVDTPSPEDYEPTIYTEEQYNTLIKKLKGHRMEAFILIAGMCGLRRGELLGLTWDDVDLKNGIITVNKNVVSTKSKGIETKDPKTKKSKRKFAIPPAIIPSLRRLRGVGQIFTRLDGEQYHPGTVSRMFRDFLEENELPHIRLHDLRHFNATMMLKYGISEREAQERLGHSTGQMTKKYQHILKEMDRNAADKLSKVINH